MKAYTIFGLLYATQADAKAAAKEHGLKFDPETDTVELPFSASPKEEALYYINRCIEAARPEKTPQAFDASSIERERRPLTWTEQREAEIQHNIDVAEEISAASYEEARKFQAMATERMVECLANSRTHADG